MPSATVTKHGLWTDRQLQSLPADGQKYELLDGQLIGNLLHGFKAHLTRIFLKSPR